MAVIRSVTSGDREAVIAIFNRFIRESFAAYGEGEMPLERFDDFLRVTTIFRVIEDRGDVIGFGFVKPYRNELSMARTGMLTYFILPEFTGQGLGTRMLRELTEAGGEKGITNWLAHISSRNEQSLAFHKKHGFEQVGRFRSVGVKFGEPFDIVWMQKDLAMGSRQ